MLIDEILEYLQYHPMSKRQDIEAFRPFAVALASVACWGFVWAADVSPASSGPIGKSRVVFTNPDRSILWKTVGAGRLEIPVPDWPETAASATLTVTGESFVEQTCTVTSPETPFVLTLTLSDKEKSETLLSFVLTYATEAGDVLTDETRAATLGFVRGVGNGTTARCIPGGENAKAWGIVKGRKAVLPVPENVASLRLDGAETALPAAPGWYLWRALASGEHTVDAVVDGMAFNGTYRFFGDSFVFIVK